MLTVTSSCPSEEIERISGATSFGVYEFNFGGTNYTLQMIGDKHGSTEGTCLECTNSKCVHVTNFIKDQLKCTDIPTHLYLEMAFIYANESVEDEIKAQDPNGDFIENVRYHIGGFARTKHFYKAYVHYVDLRIFGSLNLLELAENFFSLHRKFDDAVYAENIAPMKEAVNLDFPSWKISVDKIFEVFVYSNNFLKDYKKNLPNLFNIMPLLHFKGNNWWVDETSFMGKEGRVPIIRKEVLKLNTQGTELIMQYARLLHEKLRSLKYFKNEPEMKQTLLREFKNQPAEIVNTYIGSALMEIYTIARMLRTFDIDKREKRKNVIFYFGQAHLQHFNTWFIPLLKEYTNVKEVQKLNFSSGKEERCSHIQNNISLDLL